MANTVLKQSALSSDPFFVYPAPYLAISSAFLKRLGESLTFERVGIRLCELLIQKKDSKDRNLSLGFLPQLQQLRDEKEEHFSLLRSLTENLGADPTQAGSEASTVASISWFQGMVDPCATYQESFQILLTSEAATNASWARLMEAFVQVRSLSGEVEKFHKAFELEKQHLYWIQSWSSFF